MASASLVLLPAVLAAIRAEAFRAWRSLGGFGFEPSDIRQEFVLSCLSGFDRYDPRRSSPATFAAHSCRQRTLQIIEPHFAVKRNSGRIPESLSAPVRADGEARAELGETVADDQIAMRMGRRSRPAAELVELAIDVARVIECLPAELAIVARVLLDGEPDTVVARQLGISRSTLYRRIGQLRQIFRDAGLDPWDRVKEAA